MELSIKRTNAAIVVALGGLFAWGYLRGGRTPEVPKDLRAVISDVAGEAEDAGPAAPRPAPPTRRPEAPPPPPRAVTDEAAPPGDAAAAPAAPPRRERTPDEQARSKIALADGYAENRRYDRALEVLDEAEALGPSDAVRAEVEAARDRVTALLRARR